MIADINCKQLSKLFKDNEGASLIYVPTQAEWVQDAKPNGKVIGLNTHFISHLIEVNESRIINQNFKKKLIN